MAETAVSLAAWVSKRRHGAEQNPERQYQYFHLTFLQNKFFNSEQIGFVASINDDFMTLNVEYLVNTLTIILPDKRWGSYGTARPLRRGACGASLTSPIRAFEGT